MHWRRLHLPRSTGIFVLAAATACADQRGEGPAAPSRDELQQVVTGEAATGLDETGHFRLAGSSSPEDISSSHARDLASAYIATAGYSIRRTLERDRGGSVDLENLQACGPVLYAASAFKPLSSDVPRAYQRYYGSRWLVGFCGKGGGVEVSIAVSALADELSVVDGKIDFGMSDGNEFFSLGVPSAWDGPVGLSAERAVTRMSRQTGRRIREIPTLIAADPRRAYPQGAVWRIHLETPVKLRGKKSGRVAEEQILYAGLHEDVGLGSRAIDDDAKTLRIPTAEQPPNGTIRYSHFAPGSGKSPSDKPTTGSALLERRPDVPIVLEPATTTGED